ncbi:glycogen-binding subunit 76A-like [Amphibalanus amphitrite]|uniref:glycogen-binding subunit 76A-like n=1 Tax=Amphibalanus amphitrite TaxID=1232801 RepID=UPI001C91F167|nr:glycogen-binding subunit 76A-like [Amphibalanus amphitrite]XP_043228055.1 glycogen-binding subunit 76A-like [Amphibalanus amphitrite]
MAAAGPGDPSDSDREPGTPLCLALLRSACHTVAADGALQSAATGPPAAAVITDGPRRSRTLADAADADAFFEYDLEGGTAAPAAGHGGGGGDTGCALTSPADRTDGSGDRSPGAAAAENGLRQSAAQPAAPAAGDCGDVEPRPDRHLYENPLAGAVPVGARHVTSRPQQSPSEKVDAWLLTCQEEGAEMPSEELCPPPAAADLPEAPDDDTEDALTDADELDIGELLSRGCQLLELELEQPAAGQDCRPAETELAAPDGGDGAEIGSPQDDDTTTGSESGVSSSEFLAPDQFKKRSSSLKSSKTPPLTPGRKKYVRFADALGLELQQIRTFRDEAPAVPRSALPGADSELLAGSPDSPLFGLGPRFGGAEPVGQRQLVPMFLQPSSGLGFEERLRRDKVCLIGVTTHQEDWSVRGVVRVLNMDYYKSVCVRYTLDEWRTWSDATASYVQGSCDGFADRFHFTLYCSTLAAGQRLHFAIVFRCLGQEFWDNNHGNDYTVLCALQRPAPPDSWGASRF